MRILYTADIHVNPNHLQSMVHTALANKVDTLIVGGDVVPHHLPLEAGMDILEAQAVYLETALIPALTGLREQKEDIQIYLDLGNDDFAVSRPILEAQSQDLLHLLHMQKHTLTDQVDLLGYMMVPPTPFARKDWEKPDSKDQPYSPGNSVRLDGYITNSGSMQEIRLNLDAAETIAADLVELSTRIDGPFIFVAHCPPYDTPLDVLYNGNHVGSLSIKRFIERWSAEGLLIAALHGHIHEAARISGTDQTRINNTICINPGQGDVLQYVILDLYNDRGTARLRQVATWNNLY